VINYLATENGESERERKDYQFPTKRFSATILNIYISILSDYLLIGWRGHDHVVVQTISNKEKKIKIRTDPHRRRDFIIKIRIQMELPPSMGQLLDDFRSASIFRARKSFLISLR
jgi:hypothetical protein